ncbi:MAG: hypothetical protein LLF96_08235, partial [Eubacteriales bacterium]|nr:hypothetical protein [Eubacteriales bacterium]
MNDPGSTYLALHSLRIQLTFAWIIQEGARFPANSQLLAIIDFSVKSPVSFILQGFCLNSFVDARSIWQEPS